MYNLGDLYAKVRALIGEEKDYEFYKGDNCVGNTRNHEPLNPLGMVEAILSL